MNKVFHSGGLLCHLILFALTLFTVTIFAQNAPVAQNDVSFSKTYTSSDIPKAITDHMTFTSSLLINDIGTVDKITVKINVTHTYDADLIITLIAPDGTRVILTDNCGGSGNNFTNTIFDSSSSSSVYNGSSPFTGTYAPIGNLAGLKGKLLNGNWKLEVTDDAGSDIGTLNSWSMSINNMIFSVDENSTLNIPAPGVLSNDTDPNNDTLRAIKVTDPSHGLLALNSDGSFTYVPENGYYGTDSFTYRANDGQLDSNIATVTLTINQIGVQMNAVDDTYSIIKNTVLNQSAPGLMVNDTGANITAVKTTNPVNGTLTFNSDGSFIYTPKLNYIGVDSFTYKLYDGVLYSNTATVTIYVNVAPVAANDTELKQSYSSVNVPMTITDNSIISSVLNVTESGTVKKIQVRMDITHPYDSDLRITLISPDGTRVILVKNNGGSGRNYTDTVFDDAASVAIVNGTAPFTGTYKPIGTLNDFAGKQINGTWHLELYDNSTGDVGVINSWSLTFIQPFTVNENVSLTVNAPGVLNNDTKMNIGILSAIKMTDPAHGALTLNADGSFIYTPAIDYFGTDSFTYKANDGLLDSNIAKVTINVNQVKINSQPVVNIDNYTTAEDTLLSITAPGILNNDTDINGDSLTAILAANPSHGTLMLNANGSFRYTPALNYYGNDSFSYRVFDGQVYSPVCAVNITVNPLNDAPVNISISSSAIPENQPSGSTLGIFTTTDIDNNDTYAYSLVVGDGSTDNGVFSINGDALNINTALDYELKNIYFIRVRSMDSGGQYTDKKFNITITNVNEAPTGISLSNNVIAENKPIGTLIGILSAIDQDAGNGFKYSLVPGTGGDDNSCFTIVENQLYSAAIFDYESTTIYTIRVQAQDVGGLTCQQILNINIASAPFICLPSATDITATSAVLGAVISDNCASEVTGAGAVYGYYDEPTAGTGQVTSPVKSGAFTSVATNLTPNTKYSFRCYAVNSVGTKYTGDGSFTTLPSAPRVLPATAVNSVSFTAVWNKPAVGGTIIPLTYTVEVATDINFVNIVAAHSELTGLYKSVTGLTGGKQYFYRVKASNLTGAGAYSSAASVVLPYSVIASAGTGGTITNAGVNNVVSAGSISFTASPAAKYRVYAWLVDDVKVQDGGLTYTLSNITANHTVQVAFAAIPLPVITGFTPTSGDTGTLVTVTGTDFSGATAVSIGNTAVQFTVVSSTTITLTVPSAAASGLISVTTPVGKAYSADAFSVPLTSVSLIAAPAQQCAVGKSVTLTAAAVGGTSVQYKFLSGTTILQDFSAQNSYTWTPATAGTYQIVAVAKDISGTVVYNPQNYIVTPTLTAAALVTSPVGYALFGTPVTLTATATGGASLQYKFMNGSVIMRDFAAGNTFTWTPVAIKTYSLTVIVRDMNALNPAATVTSPVTNLTTVAALSAVTLTTTPATSSVYGSPVTLTATSTGGLSVQYKFMNGTTLMRDFAASNTFTWTPASMRTYPLTVIARDVKGTNVNATVTSAPAYLTVNAPLTAVSLAMTPSNTVAFGSQVTLAATRTGGAAVQYKFMVGTTTLRDFSTSSTAVWTPSYVKTYTQIIVIARDMNSANPAATVYSTALNLTVKPALTAVNIYTAPLSTASFGSTVTIYAGATNGASPQYKFMADGNVLRDFSAVNNYAWTPSAPGTYQLTAVVRDVNSNTPNAEISSTASSFIVTEDASVNPVDMAKMVFIPASTFTMGGITTYDTPAHSVSLSGYWIYKYEVTIAQYRAFCTATNRALPAFPANYSWKGKTGWADQALQQHPMVNVSWADAKAYADWAGVELPTEAQWEYAARGSAGNNYPWGGTAAANDLYNGYDAAKSANYSNSSAMGISTWAVGSFPAGASWSGAQDMAGNVWEWCGDWYAAYSNTPATDPTGPETGTYRILRGGSWANYGENYTRTTLRNKNAPTITATSIGFRCAKKMVD